jgi:hypothetical protein
MCSVRRGEHHEDLRAGTVCADPTARGGRRRRRVWAGKEPRLLRVYSLLPHAWVQRRHAADDSTTGPLSKHIRNFTFVLFCRYIILLTYDWEMFQKVLNKYSYALRHKSEYFLRDLIFPRDIIFAFLFNSLAERDSCNFRRTIALSALFR